MNLIEQYQHMHENNKAFRGYTTKFVIEPVKSLIDSTGAKTLLDYGSGKGYQYSERAYHEQWGGVLPSCYDPGVKEFSVKPVDKFDGVICCDVMEHIPEEQVFVTLCEIFWYARLFVVLAIFTGPARKVLPDGRNAHITQRPEVWWRERIEDANIMKIPCQAQFRGGE